MYQPVFMFVSMFKIIVCLTGSYIILFQWHFFVLCSTCLQTKPVYLNVPRLDLNEVVHVAAAYAGIFSSFKPGSLLLLRWSQAESER